MTTALDLLRALKPFNRDLTLVFATDEGEIGPGYHITELRCSKSTGIDCGGTIETTEDARLQLLDGQGSQHMRVGKFADILERSIAALPKLAEAPLLAEFGHGNRGLMVMRLGAPIGEDNRVLLYLGATHAVCKPMARKSQARRTVPTPGCCGPSKHLSTGCSDTGQPTEEMRCCA